MSWSRASAARPRSSSTDVAEAPLAVARKVGADPPINVAADAAGAGPRRAGKGVFDTLFEASGNQPALRSALDALRPARRLVQLGLGGEMTLPINSIVAKEFELRGTFRFHEEFALAVRADQQGLIDVKPLISATMPFASAVARSSSRATARRSMKVQLTF